MKHYGDITKLSGYELPPVDVVTGGSPCQNFSIAGDGTGLQGKESRLFFEMIRIIKEMREADVQRGRTDWFDIRPRFVVWENVPGAIAKREDFQRILTEFVRIAEPNAPDVPMPEKRFPKAGCLYSDVGDRPWSIAWRVHNSQFWGVAQRRRRICLILDLGGLCATEILFERKGNRRDSSEKQGKKQTHGCGTEEGSSRAISFLERAGKPGGGKGILQQTECAAALRSSYNQYVSITSTGKTTLPVSYDQYNGDWNVVTHSLRTGGGQCYPTIFLNNENHNNHRELSERLKDKNKE